MTRPRERGARTIAGAVALAAAFATFGCRTQCAADEKASKEQLQREQKAVMRGQGTCKELVTPKLAVQGDRIVLTAAKENVLGRRSDLSVSEVTDFAPLRERLVAYRSHFKAVRVAEPFEPTLYVDLDPNLEPVRVTTLLATAAISGFPRSRIYVKDVDLDVDWWIEPPEDHPQRGLLCVDPTNSGFVLRIYEEAHGSAPAKATRESASIDTLGADLAAACAGRSPCADVIGIGERDGAKLSDVARVIAATLGAAPFKGQRPRLVILTKAPIAGSLAERSMQGPSKFTLRPCGSR